MLHLQTGIRQPEAVALYEREGWTRTGPYPPYPAEKHLLRDAPPTDGVPSAP